MNMRKKIKKITQKNKNKKIWRIFRKWNWNKKNWKKKFKYNNVMIKQMFKFFSKKLRSKIIFHWNYIRFLMLSLFSFKKQKPYFMIKFVIEICHDSTFFHKFCNKITKTKINRMIYFFSKSIRNELLTFFLTKKFKKLIIEN